MKITIELFDKIERYLSGAMPMPERDLFDKEINKSNELKVIVEAQKQQRLGDLESQFKIFVNQSFEDVEDDISREFGVFPQNAKHSPIIRLWKNRSLIGIAAGILLIIGLNIWIKQADLSTEDRIDLASRAGESKVFAGAGTNDTLCNCGQDFRKEYSLGYDNGFKSLTEKLRKYEALPNKQEQCITYWQAWIDIQTGQDENATKLFEKLWKEIPQGEFHQKVGLGLMRGLLVTKNDSRLLEVVDEILAEKEYYKPAKDFAKEIKKKL
jgi:hypothetical protein